MKSTARKSLAAVLALLLLLGTLSVGAFASNTGYEPLRIHCTFYGDSKTQRGFNWFTAKDCDSVVQVVKAANYGREDLTGRDEEHAWGTLQQAHDAASAGDTIYVYPGTYNQGSKKGNSLASRLVVSKQLHFVATGSAAETEIVGCRPSSGNGYNIDGSIRCVSVTSGGAGTTFTHFTFRDGGSGNGTKQPWSYNGEAVTGGGGICCYGLGNTAWERAYLIECVISNCGATWGSAMYGGTAIRCLIKNNRGSGWGGVVCSAALWNSVVIGTKNDNSVMRSVIIELY